MFFSHSSSDKQPFCANNHQALRLLIAGCLRQVALVEFRSAGISGRVAVDGAMISGSVVTTANPGGSGIRPETGSGNDFRFWKTRPVGLLHPC